MCIPYALEYIFYKENLSQYIYSTEREASNKEMSFIRHMLNYLIINLISIKVGQNLHQRL